MKPWINNNKVMENQQKARSCEMTDNNDDAISFHGLANIGNTCFMNACLQILAHTLNAKHLGKQLAMLPLPNQNISGGRSGAIKQTDRVLFVKWLELTAALQNSHDAATPVVPREFYRAFQQNTIAKQNTQFMGFQQNDASEVVVILLDAFHNTLSREVVIKIEGKSHGERDDVAVKCCEMYRRMYSTDYSHILKTFCSICVSEIVSMSSDGGGSVLTYTPEPHFQLDLHVNSFNTLYECLEHYCQGETIENYVNDKTGGGVRETVQRRFRFWSFPPVLIINLKRFNGRGQKHCGKINFPLLLDMRSYSYEYYTHETYDYELYAVCQHYGGMRGGHYTAAIKHGIDWFRFDDTAVTQIVDVSQIVNEHAYCLWYRKCSCSITNNKA